MSCEIFQFPAAARVSPKRGKAIARAAGISRMSRVELEQEPERPARPNMHTLVFRSYALIVESAEADLARDVCFDVDKAQTKLKAIRRQLQRVRKLAEARVELLTSADNKLSAAIVAALLSARRPSEG